MKLLALVLAIWLSAALFYIAFHDTSDGLQPVPAFDYVNHGQGLEITCVHRANRELSPDGTDIQAGDVLVRRCVVKAYGEPE